MRVTIGENQHWGSVYISLSPSHALLASDSLGVAVLWYWCWNFRWTRGVTWALCHFFITHLGLADFSVLRLGQPCNLRRHWDWSTCRKGHRELEIWPRFVLRARAQQSQAVVRLRHRQRRGQHRHRLARLGEVIENSWEMYCGQNMDDGEL